MNIDMRLLSEQITFLYALYEGKDMPEEVIGIINLLESLGESK